MKSQSENINSWREMVKKYNKPDAAKSTWQIVNSLFPYILLWYLGYRSLEISFFATVAGVWLFYVQHQYEGVIWTRQNEWDYKKMALEGSSYLKFPKILQWFSGNIGFHHIHHLSPMIPNYILEKCHKENEMFKSIKPVTFIPSLRTMKLRLWDEKSGLLISFRKLKSLTSTSSPG